MGRVNIPLAKDAAFERRNSKNEKGGKSIIAVTTATSKRGEQEYRGASKHRLRAIGDKQPLMHNCFAQQFCKRVMQPSTDYGIGVGALLIMQEQEQWDSENQRNKGRGGTTWNSGGVISPVA